MANEGTCASCKNSIWCPTWAEWKCLILNGRIKGGRDVTVTSCSSYKKREKDFKERKCQCGDCLENELLLDEESDYI